MRLNKIIEGCRFCFDWLSRIHLGFFSGVLFGVFVSLHLFILSVDPGLVSLPLAYRLSVLTGVEVYGASIGVFFVILLFFSGISDLFEISPKCLTEEQEAEIDKCYRLIADPFGDTFDDRF